MGKVIKTQTGPRTQDGMNRSKMNAQTHGLYTKGLLASESAANFKSLVSRLHNDWRVQCDTGELLVNQLAGLVIRQSRLEAARARYSDAPICFRQDKSDFCIHTGIDADLINQLPMWFFTDSAEVTVRCEPAKKIMSEARYLATNYSPRLSEMACTELPRLWLEVMGSPGPNFKTSLTQRMCQIHECESDQEAIKLHIELLSSKYRFELLWLQKQEKIAAVLERMNATRVLNALSRTDWLKVELSIHRQIQDKIAQLIALADYHSKGKPILIESA
ncbi:MAG: hypothetical protein ACKO0Z_26995 [Betaproteobacteria bacterium]